MAQTLPIQLIPFHGGQLVLPQSAVVEILPYARPLKIENTPSWVTGALLWKADPVPLVSMDQLIFGVEDSAAYSRIVIIHALNPMPRLRYVGFLASKAPHQLDLSRDLIKPDTSETSEITGILQYVKVQNRPAIIPDLDILEAQLRDSLRH